MSLRQTAILGTVVPQIIETLLENKSKTIDKTFIELALRKIVIMETLKSKNSSEKIDSKLNFLKNKLQLLEEIKKEVDSKLTLKAQKRTKRFSALIFAQVLLVQYGTYVAFSWDIMEPITCLLGVLDLLIAYSFWLYTNKPYSPESIEKLYVEKKVK